MSSAAGKSQKTVAPMGDFVNQHWTPICDPTAPRVRCDEALPLGNALLGMLIWMRDSDLLLSLDRGDLWDERRPSLDQNELFNWEGICRMIAEGETDRMRSLFCKNKQEPYPTRLPGGRLEIPFTKDCKFDLDIQRARAVIKAAGGARWEFIVPAAEKAVARWHSINGGEEKIQVRMPAFEDKIDPGIAYLQYSQLQRKELNCGSLVAIENSDQTLAYAVGFQYKNNPDGSRDGAAVISVGENAEAALCNGEAELQQALQQTFADAQQKHEMWWQDFYRHSNVRFGDALLDKAYQETRYFFGCNARKDRPAVALQGIWTMDNGSLPPWRGDYHNNLNTQFTYLSYLAANDLEGGREFLDFMFRLLPVHRRMARDFYGIEKGVVIPGAMTRSGNFMPASVNYSYHPDNGLWVAWMFYRHWRYTYDDEFLRSEAYPYAREVAEGAVALAQIDEEGFYKFPWHASPELGDSSPESYFTEMTAYVNANMYALFSALAEMAGALDLKAEQQRWQEALTHCLKPELMTADYKYYLYDKKVLGIQRGRSLPNSHRHLVHLMGFYPFDLIDFERDEDLRLLLSETLNQLDFFGPGQWVGFSWPWAAMMENRLGNPVKAVRYIKNFLEGFCTVNGFNVNGDFKDLGLSAYKYRPFTLETNFEAQESMHELLLHESCGILKFFPAAAVLPEASFENLRAPGAFLISGELCKGEITRIKIYSEAGNSCSFANPDLRRWQIIGPDGTVVESDCKVISFDSEAGKEYTLQLKP